jgi:hypothetical protein
MAVTDRETPSNSTLPKHLPPEVSGLAGNLTPESIVSTFLESVSDLKSQFSDTRTCFGRAALLRGVPFELLGPTDLVGGCPRTEEAELTLGQGRHGS